MELSHACKYTRIECLPEAQIKFVFEKHRSFQFESERGSLVKPWPNMKPPIPARKKVAEPDAVDTVEANTAKRQRHSAQTISLRSKFGIT
jgi:hypothetical protein